MIELLRKLDEVVGPNARTQAYSAFGLVLVMAVVELLGVASIMPFIGLLSTPTILQTNAQLAAVYRILGFTSREAFLVFVGSLTLALLVGSVALRALTLWSQLKFINVQTHLVSSRLVGFYLGQPYEWFLKRQSSRLSTNVLVEVTNVFQGVAYPVMLLVANAIVAVLLTGLLVFVEPLLAVLAAGVLGGVYLLVFVLGRRYLRRIGEARMRSNRERHQAIAEAFVGIKDIKVAGVEAVFLERYRQPSERMAKAGMFSALIGEMPSFVMQAVVFGGMLLVLIYLIMTHGGIQEALPVIALYAFAGSRLLPTLQLAYRNLTTIRYTAPVLDSLHRDVLECERDSAAIPSAETVRVAPLGLRRRLELREISFAYEGSQQPVVHGLNLTIPALSTVALVGSTGAGKTTIVDLILGLLKPSAGHLLVDEQAITDTNLRSWQRTIGYVPQHIFLSDDSVAANIALGVVPGSIDRAAVEKAGRIANLHDFVTNELPAGYDTPVGERGVRLSGGQRQRIGIARALYHDPEFLVFDEATSALDGITEQAVMDAVSNLARKKTLILITHRLTTVRECDEINLLDRGRIVAAGSYDTLLATNDLFRAMAAAGSDGGSSEGAHTGL